MRFLNDVEGKSFPLQSGGSRKGNRCDVRELLVSQCPRVQFSDLSHELKLGTEVLELAL
jgi:hypothetical protein